MKVKRRYVILTFATTTYAMAVESLCAEKHLPGRLIPLPKAIGAGCGLCWRIPEEQFSQADFAEALNMAEACIPLEMETYEREGKTL